MRWKEFIGIVFLGALIGLNSCKQKETQSEALAKKYCSSCHIFPEPHLLDKNTWKDSVLPAMGRLMNIPQLQQNPFEESDLIISNKKAMVPKEEWNRIVQYYVNMSPAALPHQSRKPITGLATHFDIQPKILHNGPGNTFLKIDPGNRRIYAAGIDSTLLVLDENLNVISEIGLKDILVDIHFETSLLKSGDRRGVTTGIGIMNPNDFKTGTGSIFSMDMATTFQQQKILDTLPRPVQIVAADLNADAKTDYLVCGFGNHVGAFYWMQNQDSGKFTEKMLKPLPGAIKTYVKDLNRDGFLDIITLFAQGQEGIYLFAGHGNGTFEMKELLAFPPVYGSTYFEMTDFNNDGLEDILYACGDNADYSNVLKNYHGVYIFLNQGNLTFKQRYFFPLHGAFKAVARDFNKDGDLDIAAISYFPDRTNQPSEGFVFLEQIGNFQFEASSIRNVADGNWITLDADDVDSDGDDDVVIGSLFVRAEKENIQGKPTLLLLRNNTTTGSQTR